MNYARRAMLLVVIHVACLGSPAFAQADLFALSTSQTRQLEEQKVTVTKRGSSLELAIEWKRTEPIVFSSANKSAYLQFFEEVTSQWGSHVTRAQEAGRNTFSLGYIPDNAGGIDARFFQRLADGRDFADGQPRVRLMQCPDEACLGGQVHFYTLDQINLVKNLIGENLCFLQLCGFAHEHVGARFTCAPWLSYDAGPSRIEFSVRLRCDSSCELQPEAL